jgi:hypothetical protein
LLFEHLFDRLRFMDLGPLDDLDARSTLAAATSAVWSRRAAEVQDLLVISHWAALHGSDPRRGPDGERIESFGNRLIDIGGDGTPLVQEFCLGELAIARETGSVATSRAMADVLDLEHRLPQVWRRVLDLECEVWVARKVATASRSLSREQVGLVDDAVAAAIGRETPGRVIALAEAKVIEADPPAHAQRVADAANRKFVRLSRADAQGLKTVIARVTAGDGAWVDATVDRAADLLGPRHPDLSHDELRAMAFGLLARPAELLDLLLSGVEESEPPEDDPEATLDEGPELCRALAFPADLLDSLRSIDPVRLRPRATLYVHLHEAVAAGMVSGVARVEDAGPLLPAQLPELLGSAHVTVKPVIDLNDDIQVAAYEHPEALKERVWLTSRGDVFPFSPGAQTRKVDFDHPVPYDPLGPPGQTGTHNSGPLRRRHHRWKTHAGYEVRQIGHATYLWRTLHGRYYLVDSLGTLEVDPDAGQAVMAGPEESEPGVWSLLAPTATEARRSAPLGRGRVGGCLAIEERFNVRGRWSETVRRP